MDTAGEATGGYCRKLARSQAIKLQLPGEAAVTNRIPIRRLHIGLKPTNTIQSMVNLNLTEILSHLQVHMYVTPS